MDSLRKWFYKPKAGDRSLLARFFHADRSLSAVSSELDSFDGRSEPERCSRLVGRLRQGQDRVLAITGQIMDELLGNDRAPREFRVKFPEEVLQDSLGGQLWFGAECLAAGSSIMNREVESAAMRPLAKAVTKSLDNVRNLLREQCLRNNTPNGPLKLDANDILTEMLYESLKIFDKLFAEFELLYVSAMVPVKSKQEFEIQEMICVLFSETLHRALEIGLLNQEQVDSFDPALMFSIPRLAIVSGLVVFSCGPLNVDQPPENMSEMFRPFKSLLTKIRDLLWTLNKKELRQLEKLLCTNEELSVSKNGLSYDNTELVGEYCSDTSSNKVIISSFYSLTDEQSNWSSDTMQDSDAKSDVQCDNTMIQDCASGYLIPNANFGTLLQTESLLSNSFLSSDESTVNPFDANEQYITNSFENLTDLLQSEQGVADQTNLNSEQVAQPTIDSGISTGNTSLDRTPESEQSSTADVACLQSKYNDNWKELYRNQSDVSQDSVPANRNVTQSTSAIKNVNIKTKCDNLDLGEGPSGVRAELVKHNNEVRTLANGILNKDVVVHSDSIHNGDSDNSPQHNDCNHTETLSDSCTKHLKNFTSDVGFKSNPHLEVSSCDTSPCTSDCGVPREVTLAIRAAGRARFSSTEDLLHRLFVCIAGVADQLQTNFASDLRQILRSVFLMNTTPCGGGSCAGEEGGGGGGGSERNSDASFEFRASETDIVQSGGSNQSIYSAQEVVIESGSGGGAEDAFRSERSQSVTTADRTATAATGTCVIRAPGGVGVVRERERSSSFCDNARAAGMKRNHGNSTGDLDRLTDAADPSTSSPASLHHNHDTVASGGGAGSVMCPPSWVPDSSAPQCMRCWSAFTAFRRRHHCRRCGGVFCGACSGTSTPLPRYGMSKAVRVCRSCYNKEVAAD